MTLKVTSALRPRRPASRSIAVTPISGVSESAWISGGIFGSG
jgi:hypothetical protein